jgi:hypothetical protein
LVRAPLSGTSLKALIKELHKERVLPRGPRRQSFQDTIVIVLLQPVAELPCLTRFVTNATLEVEVLAEFIEGGANAEDEDGKVYLGDPKRKKLFRSGKASSPKVPALGIHVTSHPAAEAVGVLEMHGSERSRRPSWRGETHLQKTVRENDQVSFREEYASYVAPTPVCSHAACLAVATNIVEFLHATRVNTTSGTNSPLTASASMTDPLPGRRRSWSHFLRE